MSAEIVPLREGAPLLTDIPGMLRRLAEQVEAGEYGDVETLFVVLPRNDDYPCVFGWGDVTMGNDPVIQLELAKMWLLQHLVARS